MKKFDKYICTIDCIRDDGYKNYLFEFGRCYNVRQYSLSKFIYIEINDHEINIDSFFLNKNFRYLDDHYTDFVDIDKKFEKIMYD
jgi:hypothetical protein